MLRRAIESDIEKIKPYLEEFNLDLEGLEHRKLYVYEHRGSLAGFGRYRNCGNYYEIATVGVLEPFRGRGIGKTIVKQLISIIPSNEIWLTTIIPEYFKKFGFKKIGHNIPAALILKNYRICEKFNKPRELSVFMKLEKQEGKKNF